MTSIEPQPEDVEIPDGSDWESLSPFQRWYYKNKEEQKESVKSRKRRLLKWVKELRADFECETCGESHPACVQLHHTKSNLYEIRLSNMAREGYGKETIQKEIERGQILCANCHRKVHYERGDGPWEAENRDLP